MNREDLLKKVGVMRKTTLTYWFLSLALLGGYAARDAHSNCAYMASGDPSGGPSCQLDSACSSDDWCCWMYCIGTCGPPDPYSKGCYPIGEREGYCQAC